MLRVPHQEVQCRNVCLLSKKLWQTQSISLAPFFSFGSSASPTVHMGFPTPVVDFLKPMRFNKFQVDSPALRCATTLPSKGLVGETLLVWPDHTGTRVSICWSKEKTKQQIDEERLCSSKNGFALRNCRNICTDYAMIRIHEYGFVAEILLIIWRGESKFRLGFEVHIGPFDAVIHAVGIHLYHLFVIFWDGQVHDSWPFIPC